MSWLLDKYLSTSNGETSDFILWPETAIPDAGLTDQLDSNPYLETIKDRLASNTILITGAIVYKRYGKIVRDKENKTFYPPLEEYLSVHNAALEIQKNNSIRVVRTKRNLVPFEESTPYPKILTPVKCILGSLGGFSFSYLSEGQGYSEHNGIKAAPLICYEILFGDEVSILSFRSNIFFLILNEGWYKNETGSSQFLYYTSLRAVETRRSIARSSNMGIAALIDQRGVIVKLSDRIDEPSVITGYLHESDITTFYALAGDLMGKIAVIAFLGLNVLIISMRLGFLRRLRGRL